MLANRTGRVGESGIGTQLAYFSARIGVRVLYLDLDRQRDPANPIIRAKLAVVAPFTASQLLRGPPSSLPVGTFALVASDDQLSGLEREPANHNDCGNHLAALEGIGGQLNHARYGIRKIKQTLNSKLELIGILPNAVEPTPF